MTFLMNSSIFRAWSHSSGENYSFKLQHTFGNFSGLTEREEDAPGICICMYIFVCVCCIYTYTY